MPSVGGLFGTLGLDTRGFDTGIDKAKSQLRGLTGEMGKQASVFGGALNTLVGGATLVGFSMFARNLGQRADQVTQSLSDVELGFKTAKQAWTEFAHGIPVVGDVAGGLESFAAAAQDVAHEATRPGTAVGDFLQNAYDGILFARAEFGSKLQRDFFFDPFGSESAGAELAARAEKKSLGGGLDPLVGPSAKTDTLRDEAISQRRESVQKLVTTLENQKKAVETLVASEQKQIGVELKLRDMSQEILKLRADADSLGDSGLQQDLRRLGDTFEKLGTSLKGQQLREIARDLGLAADSARRLSTLDPATTLFESTALLGETIGGAGGDADAIRRLVGNAQKTIAQNRLTQLIQGSLSSQDQARQAIAELLALRGALSTHAIISTRPDAISPEAHAAAEFPAWAFGRIMQTIGQSFLGGASGWSASFLGFQTAASGSALARIRAGDTERQAREQTLQRLLKEVEALNGKFAPNMQMLPVQN